MAQDMGYIHNEDGTETLVYGPVYPDPVIEPELSPVQLASQTIQEQIAARLDETITTVPEAVQAINDGLAAAVDLLSAQ